VAGNPPHRIGLAGWFVGALTLALLALASLAVALDFPALSGRVVDEAGLLPAAERQSLENTLAAHEQATTNQVVVVTLNSLQGTTIEDFGYQLGRHWGIGQEGKDNGVLLIVAPNERKVRIEVGYGLEGVLTDAASKLIIENAIVPNFKQGLFAAGIVEGTDAILSALGGGGPARAVHEEPEPRDEVHEERERRGEADEERERRQEGSAWELFLVFMMLGVLFFVQWSPRSRHHPGNWTGGHHSGGGGFGGGGFSGGGGGFGGGGASGGW